jgi:hypothetical protein
MLKKIFSSETTWPNGAYQKRAILPYVLFLVTVAMFVGRMQANEFFL